MDFKNVEKIIRENYGTDKDEAKAGSSALISGFVQKEVTSILRKKISAVESEMRSMSEFHSKRIDGVDSGINLTGLDQFDSNTMLRVTGGSLAGYVGIWALVVPVFAPIVALGLIGGGILSALSGIFRSWQEKMARKFVDGLKEANLAKILKGEACTFWDDVEERVAESIKAMDDQYLSRMNALRALAESGPEEQMRLATEQRDKADRTLRYLMSAPGVADVVTDAA